MILKIAYAALTAALLLTSCDAFAQSARLHCANGVVSDTTSVTITGNTAQVSKHRWSGSGRVERSEAFYAIRFSEDVGMRINRSTGDAMLYGTTPGGVILLVCRAGGPRM